MTRWTRDNTDYRAGTQQPNNQDRIKKHGQIRNERLPPNKQAVMPRI